MQQMMEPDRAALAKRLFAAAEQIVRKHGLAFGEGANQFLFDRAQEGAAEIISRAEGDPDAARQLIDQAERNFARIAAEMIDVRSRMTDTGYLQRGIVGEQTLGDALGRLCPLWPIC